RQTGYQSGGMDYRTSRGNQAYEGFNRPSQDYGSASSSRGFSDSSSFRDNDMTNNYDRSYDGSRSFGGGTSSRSWSGDTERGPYNSTSSSRGDWSGQNSSSSFGGYGSGST